MNELRVDIGGSNRGFVIATEETKRIAKNLMRDLSGSTPDTFKGAQSMRDQYGKVFDGLKGEQGIGGLGSQVSKMFGQGGADAMQFAGKLGAVGAIVGGIAAGVKKAYASMRESFVNLRDAKMLGMSTTGLRKLDQANDEQGFDPGEARGRMMRFTNKVGEAAEGDKGATNFFKDMGVQVNGKTMEDILNQVAGAFDRIKDPAERAHMAVELFGRGGQEMIPILQQLKSGGGWLSGIVSDEHSDAVLGGAWKNIHVFFTKIKSIAKAQGKDILANFVEGYTGYTGEAVAPEKVTVRESDADKEAKVKAAAKAVKDLAEAQKEYHRAEESAAGPQMRLAMEMGDRDELKRALAKAEAAHDEVEVLKIKTALLLKNKEIEAGTKGLADAAKKAEKLPAHRAASEHIDTASAAGGGQSWAAVMNPTLEIGREQLGELRLIRQVISNRKDIFLK